MRFLVAVILIALAILFLLLTLALTTSGQIRHPIRVGVAMSTLLALGLALLAG